MQILPKRVAIEIRRDLTDVCGLTCYVHEVPLYKVIHGDDNVQPVDVKKAGINLLQPDKPIDAADEFARLINAFGLHPKIEISVAEFAYGRAVDGIGQNFLAQFEPRKAA
jgi:hypothetical protein